jgi:hypothetical protein
MLSNRFEGPSKIALQVLSGLFFVVLAVTLFLKATQPVSDPDFWWHLKTGEVMYHEGKLLDSDPFALQLTDTETSREKIILRGYWLWQITAYGLYRLFGFNGTFLLNLLTVTGIAAALIHQMRNYRISPYLGAPLLTAGFYLFQIYPLERPHVVSFLFAIILVGMLLEVQKGSGLGFRLPLLMCLWANSHGGFVIGLIILLSFICGAAIDYRHDKARLRSLLLWSAVGMCASLVNPNGYLTIRELFDFYGHNLMSTINEYSSTWVMFNEMTKIVAILWGLVALYLIGICVLRKIFWPEFLIALALAYLSVMHIRNIAFFSLAMLPSLGRVWQEASESFKPKLPACIKPVSMLATIALLLWLAKINLDSWHPGIKNRQMYPDTAIEFILSNDFQGNIFNDYSYGGYLLWRLAPKVRVLIDSRGINSKVYEDYLKISAASFDRAHNRPEYSDLLNAYKIDYVVHSICDGFGNVQPLMKALLHQTEWVPVYLDSQVYILARNTDNNRHLITKFEINRDHFKYRLLEVFNFLCRSNPQQVGYRVALTGMLIYMNRYEEAKRELAIIEQISPNDPSLQYLRRDFHSLTK